MARRITQAEANYRKGSPVENCGICAFTKATIVALQVMGDISPMGCLMIYRAERNPFGKTLTPNEIVSIRAMAAEVISHAPFTWRQ